MFMLVTLSIRSHPYKDIDFDLALVVTEKYEASWKQAKIVIFFHKNKLGKTLKRLKMLFNYKNAKFLTEITFFS